MSILAFEWHDIELKVTDRKLLLMLKETGNSLPIFAAYIPLIIKRQVFGSSLCSKRNSKTFFGGSFWRKNKVFKHNCTHTFHQPPNKQIICFSQDWNCFQMSYSQGLQVQPTYIVENSPYMCILALDWHEIELNGTERKLLLILKETGSLTFFICLFVSSCCCCGLFHLLGPFPRPATCSSVFGDCLS